MKGLPLELRRLLFIGGVVGIKCVIQEDYSQGYEGVVMWCFL